MVLCRFFQQGNCRYGNSCRYNHAQGEIPNQYTNYRNPNTSNPYSHVNKPTPTTPTTNTQLHELATYMRTIMTDMFQAEQGKQWLLSSYGPMKGKPNFPDFTDASFEEVRWSIYEASDDTKLLHEIMTRYAKMQQDAREKFKKYQTESLELTNIIKSVYLKQDNIFGGSNTQSTFGKSPLNETPKTNFGTSPLANTFSFAQNNAFPTTTQGGNIFSNTTQSSNIFSNAVTTQSGNIFSNVTTQSSGFGGSNTGGNIFSQSNTPFASNNIFLQQPTTQAGSLFGDQPVPAFNQSFVNTPNPQFGQNPGFGNQVTSPAFPPPYTSQPQENMFVKTNQGTIFSPANVPKFEPQPSQVVTTQANIFAQPNVPTTTQANIFSQGNQFQQVPQPSTQNIFAQGNVQVGQSNIFAKPSQPSGNIFGNTPPALQPVQNGVYSKLEDIEESDVEAFKSEQFEFGSIPTLPPPLSLCQ